MEGNKQEKLKEGTNDAGINWQDFEGEYVAFEEGKRRRLILAKPRSDIGEYDGKKVACLVFDVLSIDGIKYPQGKKFLNTSSRRLIAKLKPIAINLIEQPDCVTVDITKVGEKFATNYVVEVIKN